MRFIQFADSHLDSVISGALGLPDAKKAQLRDDIRRSVERACSLAVERQADLVLIPGDLFDFECVRPETVTFLISLFRDLAPIRIFIAPGNHDSLRPGSPYLPGSGADWPENVHIFNLGEFETVEIGELGCAVMGIGHAHRGITERLPALLGSAGALRLRSGQASPSPINILIFHGSRDGHRPAEKENVIPFSDKELAAQGFAYAAVGHYHSFGQILRQAQDDLRASTGLSMAQDDGVIGAYSGCVQGRGLDETGEKVAIVGEIDPDGCVRLEAVEVAERRIVAVEVDLTGASTAAAALARIENAIAGSGARERDIVNVSARGALAPGVEPDAAGLESTDRYFHVRVDWSRLERDYDLSALVSDSAAAPLRSAFARRMIELKNAARDEEEAGTLADAVYYGLAALDGRHLEPRDVD